MALPSRPNSLPPVIIAFDQDNFYVGVERVLNPALVGLPVGVTQKSLLATTSYEARAQGVSKLMNIRKAKEVCPTLVLVDGEDLGRYREFSIRVSRLVNSLTGGGGSTGRGVEKLGLDEIFLDASDLVYGHLSQLSDDEQLVQYRRLTGKSVDKQGEDVYFALRADGSTPRGFWYRPGAMRGHCYPGEPVGDSLSTQALCVASHLAAFVREQISETIGLSSSAGIAHSKLLAKLIGGLHKPNDQTTFCGSTADVQSYLDALPLRKLNGFGSKVVAKLQERMPGVVVDSPTVHQARTLLARADFVDTQGLRLGEKLWDLLHGIDDEPVHPSPDYPKTITVEDSYAIDMTRSYATIRKQTRDLVLDLVERLESELFEANQWQRYPTTFRMALRLDWNAPGGRDSKSARMPAFVFDRRKTPAERADLLMDKVAVGLLHDLLRREAVIRDDEDFDVYV